MRIPATRATWLGAMVPFGMVNFGPNTPRYNFNGSGGYLSTGGSGGTIDFFSVTHLSGVGCPGQGTVAMLPTDAATAVAWAAGRSASGTATRMKRPNPGTTRCVANGIVTELSATARAGIARFTYTSRTRASSRSTRS